jgi:hypothetical protein
VSDRGLQHREIADFDRPALRKLRTAAFKAMLVGNVEATEASSFSEGFHIKISDGVPDVSAVCSLVVVSEKH